MSYFWICSISFFGNVFIPYLVYTPAGSLPLSYFPSPAGAPLSLYWLRKILSSFPPPAVTSTQAGPSLGRCIWGWPHGKHQFSWGGFSWTKAKITFCSPFLVFDGDQCTIGSVARSLLPLMSWGAPPGWRRPRRPRPANKINSSQINKNKADLVLRTAIHLNKSSYLHRKANPHKWSYVLQNLKIFGPNGILNKKAIYNYPTSLTPGGISNLSPTQDPYTW